MFGFEITTYPWVWPLIIIFFYAIIIYILGLIVIKFIDFFGGYGNGYGIDFVDLFDGNDCDSNCGDGD